MSRNSRCGFCGFIDSDCDCDCDCERAREWKPLVWHVDLDEGVG